MIDDLRAVGGTGAVGSNVVPFPSPRPSPQGRGGSGAEFKVQGSMFQVAAPVVPVDGHDCQGCAGMVMRFRPVAEGAECPVCGRLWTRGRSGFGL